MFKNIEVRIAKFDYLKSNWLQITLASVTIFFGMLYIWQVNIAATKGFAMRDLEQGIEDLSLENDRLSMRVTELRSTASVTKRIHMLGLSEVGQIEYVTPGAGSFAINK